MAGTGAEELAEALSDLIQQKERLLQQAKQAFDESSESFPQTCGLYWPTGSKDLASCMKRLGVKNRKEFENLCKEYSRHENIQQKFNYLLQLENDWDKFFKVVADKVNHLPSNALQVGDMGPKEIESAGGRVVMVTFEPPDTAKKWLEETGSPFDLLCDPNRDIYKYLSLMKKTGLIISTAQINYLANTTVDMPENVDDFADKLRGFDIVQMGGNFIFDPNGRLIQVHRSKNPRDRPSVDSLLQILKNQSKL